MIFLSVFINFPAATLMRLDPLLGKSLFQLPVILFVGAVFNG
ncbi:MAG: hypothetical protein N3E47_02520 [Candidatus Bathyarchaeota archaeon]|nr:hypothetical protein [Candidatus Bathyarchaeota archaeon]